MYVKKSVIGATWIAALLQSVQASGASRPNVLFLFTDQHNAEVMGNMGHPDVITPNLDRLAASGVKFVRAYCQDAICGPSRQSLMSGLYPRTLGVLTNGDKPALNDEEVSMATAFKNAGYYTAAFGKRHLSGAVDAGWDLHKSHLDNESPGGNSYVKWIEEQGLGEAFAKDWAAEFGKGPDGGSFAETKFPTAPMGTRLSYLPEDKTMEAFTAQETIRMIKRCKESNQPFFCWASFYRPHQPYNPQKRFLDMYNTSQWKTEQRSDGITKPESLKQDAADLPPMLNSQRGSTQGIWCLGSAAEDEQLYRDYIGAYYALVTEIDYQIGEILRVLREEGLEENTIIIYSSDHGDFVGAHGMIEKCAPGHNIYEDTLRVPLLMSWKGKINPGQVNKSLVELVDLFPTLIDLTGISRPKLKYDLEGRSLKECLTEGKDLDRNYIVSENWSQSTVVTERYKLGVMNNTTETTKTRDYRAFGDMLFDLKNDRGEINNLISNPENEEVVNELRGYLADWNTRIPGIGMQEAIRRYQNK